MCKLFGATTRGGSKNQFKGVLRGAGDTILLLISAF